MKIVLATGSDLNYLNRINNYIDTIIKNSNFDENVLVYLGDEDVQINSDRIKLTKITPSSILARNSINCLQHGEFLYGKFFDGLNDNDVIVFTDGDMSLQRNLNEEEITFLKQFKDGDVYVGYNSSPTDTLYNESFRLGITGPSFDDFNFDWKSIKIYNTGVLCMNKKTWGRLLEEYLKLYPKIDTMFGHYAKQQWLISFIIGTQDYKINEMPYHIHLHNHYEIPEGGMKDENNIAYYNNKIVLFKHRWF